MDAIVTNDNKLKLQNLKSRPYVARVGVHGSARRRDRAKTRVSKQTRTSTDSHRPAGMRQGASIDDDAVDERTDG